MHSSPITAEFDGAGDASIAAAMMRGGIEHGMSRGELQALLHGLSDVLPTAPSEVALQTAYLLSGEGLKDAIVREGIVILGRDRPILLPAVEPTLRLIFLDSPINVGGGHRPVDTLFLILSATPAEHLVLRNQLEALLASTEFRDLLAEQMTGREFFACVRELESTAGVAAPIASRQLTRFRSPCLDQPNFAS